jgi:hypothetical protein
MESRRESEIKAVGITRPKAEFSRIGGRRATSRTMAAASAWSRRQAQPELRISRNGQPRGRLFVLGTRRRGVIRPPLRVDDVAPGNGSRGLYLLASDGSPHESSKWVQQPLGFMQPLQLILAVFEAASKAKDVRSPGLYLCRHPPTLCSMDRCGGNRRFVQF